MIISKVGFQSGAYDNRVATNVHLLNFEEFQSTFFEEWRSAISLRFIRMSDVARPLLPGNPHYAKDKRLQKLLEGVDVFRKYGMFLVDNGFADFFILGKPFPVEMTDPRGDPRVITKIVVKTPRQYYEIGVQAEADARRYFGH